MHSEVWCCTTPMEEQLIPWSRAESNKCDKIAKALWKTMRQQASGTQVYGKWREHWKLPVYKGQMYHSKSFEIRTQFQYEEWYFLQTCVLLVQVGILWYYTPTQLCMYTLNRRHAYLHGVCIQVVGEHTYIYINVNVRIQVCRLVHGSIRTYL